MRLLLLLLFAVAASLVGSVEQQSVARQTFLTCDAEKGEQGCYDEDTGFEYCAKYHDGGCPCEEGEVKCQASEYTNGYGYAGLCTELCCDDSEETCRDKETLRPTSCAKISGGGCGPCPEGQERCGAVEYKDGYGYAGHCTELCCGDYEETCYNAVLTPTSCAKISEGGCGPCPEGEERCQASATYAGYCTELCCDQESEELCFDKKTFIGTSCAKISEGGCPEFEEQDSAVTSNPGVVGEVVDAQTPVEPTHSISTLRFSSAVTLRTKRRAVLVTLRAFLLSCIISNV